MKKLLVAVSVMLVALLLVCCACTSDPAKTTQRDMLKYGEFFRNYSMGGEAVRFKLTMDKKNTYTLYIKNYDSQVDEMTTYSGKWSHALTYEYKYCVPFGTSNFLNVTHSTTMGIYLLEGCEINGEATYFVYEKSTGKGGIHHTNEQITVEYLEQNRKPSKGIADYKGPVELSLVRMEADKV